MSYGFRTPQEKVLSTFNPSTMDSIASFSGRALEETESRLGKYLNYSLTDKKKEFASKNGIYLSPYSFNSHSHPLCKTIENYLLYVVLPDLISNFNNIYVVSMKEFKLKIIHSNVNNKNITFNLINRLMDVKDSFRYKSGEDIRITYPTKLLNHREKYDPLLDCNIDKGKNFLFHDEMHYWSFDMMLDFLDKFEPDHVLCTVVFPVEILSGVRKSLFPEVYSFELLNNGKFLFAPDGNYSEAYEQTVDMNWIFKASSLVVNSKYFSVDLIKTVGAHHLFAITKGKRVVKETRIFRGFDILDLSAFTGTLYKMPVVDVHFSFFEKIVVYLKSLKKPDTQSAVAKFRQLSGDDLSLSEMLFIEDFADRLQRHGSASLSHSSMMDMFIDAMKGVFPDNMLRMFSSFERDNLLRQMKDAKPFEVIVQTCRVDRTFDNNQVYRFLKSLLQKETEALPCDKLIFGNLERGQDEESRDRRNIVHSLSEPLYSYPNTSEVFVSEVTKKKVRCRPCVISDKRMKCADRTPVVFKGNRSIQRDEHIIEVIRVARDYEFSKLKFQIALNSLNMPFFMPGPRRKLIESGKEAEKKGDLKDELSSLVAMIRSNFQGNQSCFRPEIKEEEEMKVVDKGKAILIEDDSEAESILKKVDVNSSSCSSDCSITMEAPLESEDHKLIGRDQRVSNLFPDLIEVIKSHESKKIKNRKAIYFCIFAHFDYGHDKVMYKNSGWPSCISEVTSLVNSITGHKFNSVLVNVYLRGGRIRYHADDEDVYDIDDNPVLTLNLSGTGVFSLKREKDGEVLKFPLDSGDMLLMKSGAQKRTRHAVLAGTDRISLTFREQKRSRSKIVDPISLPSLDNKKNLCLLVSLSKSIGVKIEKLISMITSLDRSFIDKIERDEGMTIDDLSRISNLLGLRVKVLIDGQWSYFGVDDSSFRPVSLMLTGRHFEDYKESIMKLKLNDEETSLKVKDRSGSFFSKFVSSIDPRNKFINKFEKSLNFDRCAKLLHSLLRGTTGVISSSSFGIGSDAFTGRKKNIDPELLGDKDFLKELLGGETLVKGSCILGFAGCGKSRPVQMALNNLDSPLFILIISPRINLLEDWKSKVSNKKVVFKTFESAFRENFSKFSIIIIDEFLLVPRGFTDLVAFKSKMDAQTCKKEAKEPRILLIGDPLQSSYFNHSDEGSLAEESEMRELDLDYPRYMAYSHRMSKSLSDLMEIPMLGDKNDEKQLSIYSSAQAAYSERAFDVILVAGRIEKTFFSNYKVMTFGESQGLTFEKVAIALTEDTLLCSDNHVMVALTRAKRKVSFIKCFNQDLTEFKKRAGSKLIGKVLNHKKISKAELIAMTGLEDIEMIEKPPTFGGQEERVEGDPWMKSLLSLHQEVEMEEIEIRDEDEQEVKMKVHIPVTDKSYALTIINDQIRAKEYREFRSKDAWSCQFKDDDKNLNLESSTGPVNFEAIFPRHSSFDDVTFWAAVKKRLTFSNPLRESEKLSKSWVKGEILYKEFKNMIRVSPNFRPDLFDRARIEFEEVRMRKSSKLIEAHSSRSDPDWDIRNFLLFMKTQLCKKAEKQFCDAKAGQTIACFAHAVLFKFSAWTRYAELKVKERMPESFYVHSKKNFDDLEMWVKENFIGPICVESDYEAFDSSQDASILAFEVLLLKDVGWPNELIEDYKTLKLELGCKLGNLAIMRFTGEFGTFFFNTLANMAFTFCRYNVNRRTPICFAGDDMCILADAKVRHDMDDFIGSLKLKAKVEWKINPIFCGWILSRRGILKLPSLVYYRLCIAMEKGNLKDCIDSYMIEAGYAYEKGAYIEELLDETQLNFHQLVIRRMIKSKHLMKGSSVMILEDVVDNFSDGVGD